mmetsp:Transcript_23308/g.68451  ORF Transcript_23308/g.68451 Transcript_23308/m.68451 type:complete len:596 (-) Transcript_23308:61-1848(-)
MRAALRAPHGHSNQPTRAPRPAPRPAPVDKVATVWRCALNVLATVPRVHWLACAVWPSARRAWLTAAGGSTRPSSTGLVEANGAVIVGARLLRIRGRGRRAVEAALAARRRGRVGSRVGGGRVAARGRLGVAGKDKAGGRLVVCELGMFDGDDDLEVLAGVFNVQLGARGDGDRQAGERQRQEASKPPGVFLVDGIGDALAELVAAAGEGGVVDGGGVEGEVLLDDGLDERLHGPFGRVEPQSELRAAAHIAVGVGRVKLRVVEKEVALPAAEVAVAHGVLAVVCAPRQDLEGLEHNVAGDDGVRRGDRRDDVASDLLDVPPRLARDAKDGRAQVGRGRHKVERLRVVLVKCEAAHLRGALLENHAHRLDEDGRVLVNGPRALLDVGEARRVWRLELAQHDGGRRLALLPQRFHCEQPAHVCFEDSLKHTPREIRRRLALCPRESHRCRRRSLCSGGTRRAAVGGRVALRVALGSVHEVCLLAPEELLEEQLLGPRDAMDRLVRVVSDRADRVRLLRRRRVALVALRLALDDRAHLPEVALRAALDERDAAGEADAVDVAARVDIVERVEHDGEGFEEVERVGLRLDVRVLRLDL